MAAVKISSVRRKAAQKFWAPQQGHPSPVPLAPLPKEDWHGEAVTGGFFFTPVPYTQKYRPKPWLRAVFLHNTIIHFMLSADYKPAATMQSSTRVKITNTAPTHLVAFASLASMVRALPLDI